MKSRDEAYRGYLIRSNPMTGEWWVEKGGSLICWATDRETAKVSIDTLMDEPWRV